MTTTVLVPTALRGFTGGQARVELEGDTVGELLANLVSRYGELRPHLYDDGGRLRSYVNVYVNDEDCRHLEREATRIAAGDVVSIVPSIAGGS